MTLVRMTTVMQPLKSRDKTKKKSNYQTYQGKKFQDKDEDGCFYTGVVVNIVKVDKSGDICFEYRIIDADRTSDDDELRYIVVDYETSTDCVWLDLDVTTEDDNRKKQKIWPGYAILADGEIRNRGLFDHPLQTNDLNLFSREV